MSFLALAVVAAATFVTSFISGILGMAGGMILMGILIALLPVATAMLLHGITQFAANGWRTWMLRGSVRWRVFRGYAIGSIAAFVFFGMVQIVASKPMALIMLGAMPFLALMLPSKWHLNVERRWHSEACGAVCMALALVAGVSGPVLDVFFIRSKMGRHAVVASKASTQSLTHLLKIVYFGEMLASGNAGDGALDRRGHDRSRLHRHHALEARARENRRLGVSQLDALDDDERGRGVPG